MNVTKLALVLTGGVADHVGVDAVVRIVSPRNALVHLVNARLALRHGGGLRWWDL